MYQHDRAWGDSKAPQVMAILRPLIPHCVVLSVADVELDNKQATDFTIQLIGGSIAVRLRRPRYTYRDLTIRAYRENGVKTELAKIKEGYAFRYFYGWTDENGAIAEWMLIDMDRLRATNLLDRQAIPNKDGTTSFIAISARELQQAGCLIACQIPSIGRRVNPDASLDDGIKRVPKCYSPRVEMNQQALWEV